MKPIKLACFDLDDTLIREVHSVMIPCLINGKEAEHAVIQEREAAGELDYITADYLRSELLEGLQLSSLEAQFLDYAKPLKRIQETIKTLQDNGIQCIVITVGPVQVAKIVALLWGFDGYYGSDYEVIEGRFTGKIASYVSAESKLECLKDYCAQNQIQLEACVSIGDGSTDIPVFKACGTSIALNASDRVKEASTHWVDTDDLTELVDMIRISMT